MRAVRYRPDGGSDAWRAAVTGTALAVLPPEVTPHAVEAVWRRLDGGGIGAVLESLTGAFGTSLTAIPPFGLAVAEGDGIRVAVRGPVELLAHTPAGPESISGAGVSTWTERFLPGATRVTVELREGGEADTLPIDSGVVPAASVVLDLEGGSGPASGPVPVPAKAAPKAAPTPVPEPPAVDDASVDETPAASAVDDAPANHADEAVNGETVVSASARGAQAEEPAPVDDPAPIEETVSGMVTEVPGATIAPSVAADDDPVLGETIASPRTAKAELPAIPPVPAMPPFVPPAPPVPGTLGDHDGATISVAEARALRGESAPTYDSTDNVPDRSPSQGRIRLADGRTFELERTVIIGRRPRSTRPAEAELPTLIAVDGPQHDISRNHVELRAEGEHVLAVDLASTNGTVLLRGGHDPVRLHPNEPTMVVNADVLDLGDGVTLTFEDLP
ncbi:FHA domain-containing protein [Microbacterium dauci]|uniref:FHA domain-containing protein n=1 Tax=Microbacterium dauci TaxID=3048008 RepID=A0ABT6ZCK0_9MICO|nr:FHA domain-containing protein [Microbacterium sp. LX3-4]MDJ1113877.1 FHA domain-containing protein [Microbacterium sp. LX3-4]